MNIFLLTYLIIGFTISSYIYFKLQQSGLTGDQLISMLPDDDYREYLYNNPNTYCNLIIIGIILFGLFWPITLISIITHLDDIDKFGKL